MDSSTQPDEGATISDSLRRYSDRVRSTEDLKRLSDFERRMYMPLILSAILPIVAAASNSATDSWVSITVNVAAWIVFVIDLVVHVHYVRRYMRTPVGAFDLVIVVITAPWFLIPGFSGSQILVLARLARLIRLLFVTKAARRAANRLGKVGLFSVGMLLFCSWMAYVAERPTNDEFATFGDALWWGVVTLTTVGYGDIVPETQQGRIAGVFLMLTGIATLGLISGTLAGLFRLGPSGSVEADAPAESPEDTADQPNTDAASVFGELTALRGQLTIIERQLASLTPQPRAE